MIAHDGIAAGKGFARVTLRGETSPEVRAAAHRLAARCYDLGAELVDYQPAFAPHVDLTVHGPGGEDAGRMLETALRVEGVDRG